MWKEESWDDVGEMNWGSGGRDEGCRDERMGVRVEWWRVRDGGMRERIGVGDACMEVYVKVSMSAGGGKIGGNQGSRDWVGEPSLLAIDLDWAPEKYLHEEICVWAFLMFRSWRIYVRPAAKNFYGVVRDSLSWSSPGGADAEGMSRIYLGAIPDLDKTWWKWWWNQKCVANLPVSVTNRGSWVQFVTQRFVRT